MYIFHTLDNLNCDYYKLLVWKLDILGDLICASPDYSAFTSEELVLSSLSLPPLLLSSLEDEL